MNKEIAMEVQTHSLNAIVELTKLLNTVHENVSSEDFERIKRGVGLSIGRIQTEILDIVYEEYPELDHLKDIKYDIR
jgi:hypothetical protein